MQNYYFCPGREFWQKRIVQTNNSKNTSLAAPGAEAHRQLKEHSQ